MFSILIYSDTSDTELLFRQKQTNKQKTSVLPMRGKGVRFMCLSISNSDELQATDQVALSQGDT